MAFFLAGARLTLRRALTGACRVIFAAKCCALPISSLCITSDSSTIGAATTRLSPSLPLLLL
jgi:hypothetical protein